MPFTPFSIVIAAILLLPWLALVGLGGYWLWQQGWLYHGLGILSASVALAYALLHFRRRGARPVFFEAIDIKANPNWTGQDQQAWQSLEALAERWQQQPGVLTDANKLMALTNEVITLVARQYHADSQYPLLEFPLPYLLKLVVLVCEDLQHEVLDKIPGSHALRVIDLLRAKQAVDTLGRVKSFYSVGNWLFNWPGATLGKARDVLFSKGLTTITTEISQRLLRIYIGKLGFYAIQLYSGQITLEDLVPAETVTTYSQADITENHAGLAIEPLRILVLGQISSGKSSLINALFGEIKSAEGWLPTTATITPYVLERDGLNQAIILDSAGYGGLAHPDAPLEIKREWAKIDVILMVCKANQAARAADTEQLNAIRDYFQNERRNQALPVIIAVVTHIDQLRPIRDWQPPYNIQQPDSPKAHGIRLALETVASDLQLPLNQVVPVCLASDRPHYNIDDGLMPVIHEHLNDAQRVRYLRCLRQQQAQSYWKQWRKQMTQLGQVILDWA